MKKWILFGLLATGPAVYAGEIADLYKETAASTATRLGSGNLRSHEQVGSRNHGITEVALERTRCHGTCPVYSVVLKSDGTLRYKGEAFVPKIGSYTGEVNAGRLNTLFQFIKDSGYQNLRSTYSRGITDSSTVYTSVVMDGQRKVIKNYANSGPTKLWALEQLIDKMMSEAQWDKNRAKKK